MSLIHYLKILSKIKIRIFPPKKSDLLIYDRPAVEAGFVDVLFKNQKYEIMDIRYETINLYILILSILKSKLNLKKLSQYYKMVFLKKVNPKIVYTISDNNPAFYDLKNIYSKPIYISDQFGIAKVVDQTWPNDFSKKCTEMNKRSKNKLRADLVFVFNESEKKQMQKYIHGKIEALGTTKCNNFLLTKEQKKKQKKKITFINSGLYEKTIHNEIKIFNYLKSYCIKKNIKLEMLSRKGAKSEKYYRDKFGKGNWKYLPSARGDLSAYRGLSNNSLIVFSHSSLGLEALAIGHRCVIFLHKLAKKNMRWSHSNEGFFWSNKLNSKNINKVINKIMNINLSTWEKKSKKIIKFYLEHDYKNKRKKKMINKLIKKY